MNHTRLPNTRAAIAARVQEILQRIARCEQPKCIAADIGMHETSVRNLLRRKGWAPMIVSDDERKLILTKRMETQ